MWPSNYIKPRVLFALERHLGCDCRRDLAPHYYSTVGTLKRLEWAEVEECHIDLCSRQELVAVAERFRPDLAVLSYVLEFGGNVDLFVIDELRRYCGKIMMLWQESSENVVATADKFNDHVDFHVVIDSSSRYGKYTNRPERYLAAYDPRDPAVFYGGGEYDRCIGIGFAGTLTNRPYRIVHCANLWAAGVPLAKVAGQNELLIELTHYAEFMRRSLIQLNFSDSGPMERHYKGRVAEITLCGAMLMELDNQETSTVFEPFVEYVPFNDPADLISKARYYLSHPDEALTIAAAGQLKAQRKLDGREFWSAVFNRAGLSTTPR